MGSFPERIKRSSQRGGCLYRELGKSSSLTNIFIILTFKSSDCSDRSLISEGLPLFKYFNLSDILTFLTCSFYKLSF